LPTFEDLPINRILQKKMSGRTKVLIFLIVDRLRYQNAVLVHGKNGRHCTSKITGWDRSAKICTCTMLPA